MYIPYVAFHTTVFERMIAAFREIGTIGYLMYLADSIGYLGYVGVMIFGNLVYDDMNFLKLLNGASLTISVVSLAVALLLGSYLLEKDSATGRAICLPHRQAHSENGNGNVELSDTPLLTQDQAIQ